MENKVRVRECTSARSHTITHILIDYAHTHMIILHLYIVYFNMTQKQKLKRIILQDKYLMASLSILLVLFFSFSFSLLYLSIKENTGKKSNLEKKNNLSGASTIKLKIFPRHVEIRKLISFSSTFFRACWIFKK